MSTIATFTSSDRRALGLQQEIMDMHNKTTQDMWIISDISGNSFTVTSSMPDQFLTQDNLDRELVAGVSVKISNELQVNESEVIAEAMINAIARGLDPDTVSEAYLKPKPDSLTEAKMMTIEAIIKELQKSPNKKNLLLAHDKNNMFTVLSVDIVNDGAKLTLRETGKSAPKSESESEATFASLSIGDKFKAQGSEFEKTSKAQAKRKGANKSVTLDNDVKVIKMEAESEDDDGESPAVDALQKDILSMMRMTDDLKLSDADAKEAKMHLDKAIGLMKGKKNQG